MYDRSCALGPGIVPVWAAPPRRSTSPSASERGRARLRGSTSTASITRRFEDLAGWLMAALTFPVGAVLLTGTGIVPDESFSLRRATLSPSTFPASARSPIRSSSSAGISTRSNHDCAPAGRQGPATRHRRSSTD